MKTEMVHKIEKILLDFGLSKFTSKIGAGYFTEKFKDNSDAFTRVANYFLDRINSAVVRSENSLQRGCPNIFRGLTARPFWNNISDDPRFSWTKNIESSFQEIKNEFISVALSSGTFH